MDLVSSSSHPEKCTTVHPKSIDDILTGPSFPEGIMTRTLQKSIVNPVMMNIAFADKPGQGEVEVCKEVEERWEERWEER